MMAWDKSWEKVYQTQGYRAKYPNEYLIRFIASSYKSLPSEDRKKVKVLEVGCGPGAEIWYLAREGFSVYGIDGSQAAVQMCQERLKMEGLAAEVETGDIAKLPYPDLTVLEQESPNTKMNLYSDQWLYARDDTVTIQTDTMDITSIPWRFRWTLKEPDGTEYYLRTDGSKLPTTADAWIDNELWERGVWNEQRLELLVEETGVHVITIECLYSSEQQPNNNYILTTRFLYYVPVITPEIVLALPEELRGASAISFDSDGKLWFKTDDDIYLGNISYDYFLADYAKQAIWLREDYTSVRVVL